MHTLTESLAFSAPKTGHVSICFAAQLVGEYEQLESQLKEALRTPATSLKGNGSAVIAQRMDELRMLMLEHTHDLAFEDPGRTKYGEVLAANGPREGNAVEQQHGYAETFLPALVQACVVSPKISDDDLLTMFGWEPGTKGDDDPGDEGALSDAQRTALVNAAWEVARRDVSVPFSHVASLLLQTSSDE